VRYEAAQLGQLAASHADRSTQRLGGAFSLTFNHGSLKSGFGIGKILLDYLYRFVYAIFRFNDLAGLSRPLAKSIDTDALAGRYRLTKAGTTLTVFYDIGKGWEELQSTTVPASPAQVIIGIDNVNVPQAFTTYFDNFYINSGLTTYRP
jgi:hypothetical protein